jgi:hypothetical protein
MNKPTKSKFQRGTGCYVCRICKHRTRDTGGDGAGVQLCDLCYDISGTENAIADGCEGDGYKEHLAELVAQRAARNAPAPKLSARARRAGWW